MKYTQYLFLLLIAFSCRKEFLNETPTTEIKAPDTVTDYFALLDNEIIMDRSPVLGEASSDDYYFTDEYFNTLSNLERNTYLWAADLYEGNPDVYDWNTPYSQILQCNTALEGYNKFFSQTNAYAWNDLKANALFKRAFAYYNLAGLFSPPFDSSAMTQKLGLPLRLTADSNEPIVRSSIQDTYNQIISDLRGAAAIDIKILPDSVVNRPCKAAVYGLLSRVFLSMRLYDSAMIYASAALQLNIKLTDYNTISTTSTKPFTVYNIENLYTSKVPNSQFQSILPNAGQSFIDSTLYQSYSNDDLRKSIFFLSYGGNKYRRKIFYDGTIATLYTGIASDELYLNLAECQVRKGDYEAGISTLNQLLQTRYKTNKYIPYMASNPAAALSIILTERRKELVMRCIRWTDLRRLNLEGAGITPLRKSNGNIYLLAPNSHRYILPIPPGINIPQNPG